MNTEKQVTLKTGRSSLQPFVKTQLQLNLLINKLVVCAFYFNLEILKIFSS